MDVWTPGRGMLTRAARAALDALLPQRCAACGCHTGGLDVLCPACRGAIPRLSIALCARCLAAGREPVGGCAHAAFAVWPAWVYDRRAEAIVHALKYGARPRVSGTLGGELARAAAHLRRADIVLEVPLHPARERERGYNQSARLAVALGESLGVPRIGGILRRARPTRAQARLGPRERRDNVRGAFRVEAPDWVRDRRVLVVDDVMTTGATLEACLSVLAEAGARPAGVVLAWAQ